MSSRVIAQRMHSHVSSAIAPARRQPERRPLEAKPFLKWVGGKRQLLPHLREVLPANFGTFFEPFVGGAALFFDLTPSPARLSDVNLRLVRTYRAVRDDVERVISRLELYKRNHDRDFFYSMRTRDIDQTPDVEVAAWMIYLNKTAFNGLYRVNKGNGFNVPLGSYKKPSICAADNLRACSEVLQGVEIAHEDFSAVLEHAQPGDVVYFDPPYVPLTATSNFTAYSCDGFGIQDQVRLRDVAAQLKERDVTVVLSNSWTPVVHELYGKGFDLHEVHANRAINCKGKGRGRVSEAIIT